MRSSALMPPVDAQPVTFRNDMLAYQAQNYDWEQVIRTLRKHSRLALVIVCGLTILIGFYVWGQSDFYKPVARLEIAPPGSGINTLHEIESPVESENQDYLETQVQILGSDALAVSVIRELQLDKNPEFVSPGQLKMSAREQGATAPATVLPGEMAILRDQLSLANLSLAESIALDKFHRSLAVNSTRNTRLVEISFTSHDPQMAQLVTNTLITKFIDQNYKNRYTTTMQASEWLASQLNDLRTKVEQTGQTVAEYQKKHGLVEVDDRDVPLSQLMGEINHQLSEAQANRIEDEAYVRAIDEGHGDAIPALRDDKLYQDLMGHYTELRTQMAQAKAVYGDENVNVKKLQDQLAELSVQIDSERKRALSRTRSAFLAAKHREALMIRERDTLRSKMAHMSSQLATYHLLKTEANANVELYDTLTGRLREAGIYAGLRSSNIRVVDLASNLRKPTGPHRGLLFAFGLLGSCVVAIAASFLREGFRNTVRTPDDVRSWTGLPSLALLPAIATAGVTLPAESSSLKKLSDLWPLMGIHRTEVSTPEVEVIKAPTAQSEAMRDLRTVLFQTRQGPTPRVILISSSTEGEGKTTVAVNFAVALAQLGKTCLLECDLRQPRVASAFKIHPQHGLTDYLQGLAQLREVVVDAPDIDNLLILPCGTVPDNPSDILTSPHMVELLDTLKSHCSYVVIDSPPVIPFSDARFLSRFADEVVLVGRYGVTTRRAMQRTTELLSEMHASVAGVVLNGIDLSSPDYEYYSYGYSKSKSKRPDETIPNIHRDSTPGDDNKPGTMGAHA